MGHWEELFLGGGGGGGGGVSLEGKLGFWDWKFIAFSPLVIVGVASPIVVVMVTVFYIMKE